VCKVREEAVNISVSVERVARYRRTIFGCRACVLRLADETEEGEVGVLGDAFVLCGF
jgi:hypothetical protein